jgi:hypothetical protein
VCPPFAVLLLAAAAAGLYPPVRSARAFGSPAKMTGEGVVIRSQDETTRVTLSFALSCGPMPVHPPNTLEIDWNGNSFRLDTVTHPYCYDDPAVSPDKPAGSYDTIWVTGVGRYNGVPGYTITACFTDAGEAGDRDTMDFVLHDPDGNEVFIAGGTLIAGNIQAHK